MPNMNHVVLCGNLVADPELKVISETSTVCTCRIAVNRNYTSQGEQRSETCYLDCELWGKQAEIFKKFMKKGRPVLLQGRLKQDTWIDKETQGNRSKIIISVTDFQFLDGGNKKESSDSKSQVATSPGFDDSDQLPF